MKVIKLACENEMLIFASQIANISDSGTIIYLYGELGAGKTTFTRGFLRGLGYVHKVKSPTYTLVESYNLNNQIIYHFDLYRLNTPQELEDIGIREYFTPGAICLIEWPEKGFPILPEPDIACHIRFNDEGREITIIPHSLRGEEICLEIEKMQGER